jgi:hypothetical protein
MGHFAFRPRATSYELPQESNSKFCISWPCANTGHFSDARPHGYYNATCTVRNPALPLPLLLAFSTYIIFLAYTQQAN